MKMSFFISNFSDALFFTSWTAVTAFQTTTAIIDTWKWLKKWRRPVTDYEHVISGEMRLGWHVAIPRNQLLKYYQPTVQETNTHTGHYNPFDLWTDDFETQSDLMTPPWTSSVFWDEKSLPNGNAIHQIRRISFIQPNADSILLKVICDPKEWALEDYRYLTSRNLMVTFRRNDRSEYRIFLLDAFRKGYQSFVVVQPEPHLRFSFAYVEQNSPNLQLHLMWKKFEQIPGEIGIRLVFVNAVYDLPSGTSNSATFIAPSSVESIFLFPGGNNWWRDWFNSGIPLTAVTSNYQPNQDQNTDHIQCLTFDHRKKWKRETLTEWLAEFGKSESGKRIRNAAKSFMQLSLPDHWEWIEINAMKEFNRIFTVPKSDAVFAMTNGGGILKCWIRPPSLLRTAAEHLFKANPDLKLSDVAAATGIDLSDGIPDEDEENCEIVTLL